MFLAIHYVIIYFGTLKHVNVSGVFFGPKLKGKIITLASQMIVRSC